MPIQCVDCGQMTTSYTTRLRADKFVSSCKVCEHPPTMDRRCVQPFAELTLDHVTGDDGKPLRVTSVYQLREAERRYGFKHWTSNMLEENFDKPPQQDARSIAEVMDAENKWLYPDIARPMLKEMERNGELLPVRKRG